MAQKKPICKLHLSKSWILEIVLGLSLKYHLYALQTVYTTPPVYAHSVTSCQSGFIDCI